MWKILAVIVFVTVFSGELAEAADCCSAYTDFYGKYHPTELCEDYCCLNPSLSKLKTCCSDITWRVSSDDRNEECFKSWVEEHIWVPIVGGIIFIVIVVGICTCCCCCGCCACCRQSPAPVVIHSPGLPQTTVAMQQTAVANSNPVHYGYDQ